MENQETKNEAHIGGSGLNEGLGLQTRDAVIWALCELLDGEHKWWRIQEQTGCEQQKCELILAIRDAVKDEWIKNGMVMPNADISDAAPPAASNTRKP